MMDSSSGKKPKSAELIRDRLTRLQEQAGRPEDLGPHRAGLQASDRIAVATFFDAKCAAAYQERLLEGGVHSVKERHRGRTAVLVDLEDRVKAVTILNAHLAEFPDRRQRKVRGFEATLFLSLIGLLSIFVTLVMIGNIDNENRVSWIGIGAAIAVTGVIMLHSACVGLLIDLVRSRQLDVEKGKFNLTFILWLTTVAALFFYWRR